MRYRPIVAFALLLASGARAVTAQPAARVLVAGGTATDLRGVRSGAYTIAPSLLLAAHPAVALSLGGRGTRFDGGEWSLGGTAALALRGRLGAGVSLLLNGNGDAIGTSYHATYLSAEGLPALEWRRGPFSLWGGVHAAVAQTSLELAAAPGHLLPGSNGFSRSLVGPAFGGAIQLASLEHQVSGGLSYREEHGRPDGVPVIDRSAAMSFSRGAVSLAGTIGKRSAVDESRLFGGARLSVALRPAVALIGAAESYVSNRLTGALGGRAFTAGIALTLGGPHAPRPLPTPAGVPRVGRELTRLSLAAPEATRVEVAGDWNGWRPVPLVRSANGVWYTDLAIPPGVYRYAFRVNGTGWEVPKGVAAVNDGFGGKSAWLTVGESGRTAGQSANRKEAP